MGRFINKGNIDFTKARNSEYVDKSAMIQIVNETLDTENYCSCVTRGRRFGKSMAARMLYAYYDKFCDSRHLFEDLAIAKLPSFEQHLNKYPVIYIDMTTFTTDYKGDPDLVNIMQKRVREDVCKMYPDVKCTESDRLMDALFDIAESTKERFIMIIDEWDAICREFEDNPEAMRSYVDWLRRMFKSGDTAQVFVGVYMTGILPIKRYNTESALNNFREYSMLTPGKMEKFFGFTESEVEVLCKKHGMDMSEMRRWYDGYRIGRVESIFNPYSVMNAIRNEEYLNFWSKTGAFDNVATYIQMNYEGLKDDIIGMLAGEHCDVDTDGFSNDLRDIHSKDDVLTVLIHLGYLTYDMVRKECFVPNLEVSEVLQYAVKRSDWTEVIKAINNSKKLMEATWNCREQAVADALQAAHTENTSILSYNNENSMACVLAIAYIWAKNEYVVHREYATGDGYADLVMIPRHNSTKPAIIVELKFNDTANTAIDQIHNRNYPEKVREYADNLLLVGVSYNRATKEHSCRIESISGDSPSISGDSLR